MKRVKKKELFLRVRFKQVFALSWHSCYHLETETHHLSELSAPQSEDEEKERLISNQQKTHADMQTQPERGQ